MRIRCLQSSKGKYTSNEDFFKIWNVVNGINNNKMEEKLKTVIFVWQERLVWKVVIYIVTMCYGKIASKREISRGLMNVEKKSNFRNYGLFRNEGIVAFTISGDQVTSRENRRGKMFVKQKIIVDPQDETIYTYI